MNQQEIRALYAKVIAYDNRKPSEANITAWAEQAEVGRWSLQEALDAVTEHHRRSTDFLMPAHLHEIIRENRRQPALYVAQIEGPEPADESTRERIMTMVGRRFSMPVGRQRKPQPKSADHQRRREQAEAELAKLREEAQS